MAKSQRPLLARWITEDHSGSPRNHRLYTEQGQIHSVGHRAGHDDRYGSGCTSRIKSLSLTYEGLDHLGSWPTARATDISSQCGCTNAVIIISESNVTSEIFGKILRTALVLSLLTLISGIRSNDLPVLPEFLHVQRRTYSSTMHETSNSGVGNSYAISIRKISKCTC